MVVYCDKSVNKERGTGTGDQEPERGTRPWNKARETLRPYPNSVTGTGNEDRPCVYMCVHVCTRERRYLSPEVT